jgi:predicted acylesterase/phospholipase RssA
MRSTIGLGAKFFAIALATAKQPTEYTKSCTILNCSDRPGETMADPFILNDGHGEIWSRPPTVPDSWVDRPDQFAALKASLLRDSKSSQLARLAVWGWTGTGKRALVARVCDDPDIVAAYPGGILWLNADPRWNDEAVRKGLRTALGVSGQGGEHGPQQAPLDRRYLLVVDNVWSLNDLAGLFEFGAQSTQVVITTDAEVGGQCDGNVHLGLLTPAQLQHLLGPEPAPAEPANPRFAIAQRLVMLPLGATLVRLALDRRIAQGATPSQAWEQTRAAFGRQDILAFDQLDSSDRGSSIARSLDATLARLTLDERSLLIAIAKGDGAPGTAADPANPQRAAQARRLANLGLIDLQSGQPTVNPLVEAYLLVEGWLDKNLGSDLHRPGNISSSADKRNAGNPDVERAKLIVRGATAPLGEITRLAKSLTGERYFTYARQLYALALKHPGAGSLPEEERLDLVQKQALCTYRDPDLPADSRFTTALELLASKDLNAENSSSETLGLAGAIHKYRWKLGGLRRHLEKSVSYYGKGAARDVTEDQGYTGINAAFMLDVLAQQERADVPAEAHRHSAEARAIRERIASELPPFTERADKAEFRKQWWFLATVAEACFGLGRFREARYWLREGLALNPPKWELESTTRQLVGLAVAQQLELTEGSEAQRTLRVILSEATYAVRGATIGKVGLALSGGGFRASLFHIGVLARLAELDMLRYVEVLSCVSGGSIVGAHYYLEVRRLLQEKPDAEITRADYIEIVRRLERDFLAATQKNLRLRLFASPWANLWSLLKPGYTRTTHLGWLYEKHIYSRVRDGYSSGRRWLNELQIRPRDDSPDFNPKLDNWARSAKAPILLLNATTLNTGHNWQFTVSWMGEPPLGASSSVDCNDILRRMYYWEAPLKHQRVELGQAVAASACVPSLFDPVEFRGLYPDRSVRLVDGGTHDNQGVVGLLEQECTVMLVSDASGQSSSENYPSEEILSVGLRSSNILMARVREAEYRRLDVLNRASALGGLVFLHLKKDLDAANIDWLDCQDPNQDKPTGAVLTSYGMPRSVQSRLASIRTDLDAFSDNEGYALMLSGYRMMAAEFEKNLPHLQPTDPAQVPWNFLTIDDVVMRTQGMESEHADLLHQLSTGSKLMFKAWQINPVLKGLAWVAKLLAKIAAFVFALLVLGDVVRLILRMTGPYSNTSAWGVVLSLLGDTSWLGSVLATLRWPSYVILGFGVVSFVIWLVHLFCGTRKSMTVIATGLLVGTVGWFFALINLGPLNWIYLQSGKVSRRPERLQLAAPRSGLSGPGDS